MTTPCKVCKGTGYEDNERHGPCWACGAAGVAARERALQVDALVEVGQAAYKAKYEEVFTREFSENRVPLGVHPANKLANGMAEKAATVHMIATMILAAKERD